MPRACTDTDNTGLNDANTGEAQTCESLARSCQHPVYGAQIREKCPVACDVRITVTTVKVPLPTPPYPFRHSSALGVPMWFPNDAYLDPAVAQPANSRRTLTHTPYAPARCDCNAVAFFRTRVCHARASNPAIGAMPDHQGTKVQRLSPHRLRRSSQRCTAEMSTVERELRRRIARCRHSDQVPGDVRRAVPAHDDHNDAHTSDGAAVHRRGGHGTDRCFHQRSHVVFRLGKHVLQRKLWRKRPAGVPNHVRNPVPDNGRT